MNTVAFTGGGGAAARGDYGTVFLYFSARRLFVLHKGWLTDQILSFSLDSAILHEIDLPSQNFAGPQMLIFDGKLYFVEDPAFNATNAT